MPCKTCDVCTCMMLFLYVQTLFFGSPGRTLIDVVRTGSESRQARLERRGGGAEQVKLDVHVVIADTLVFA